MSRLKVLRTGIACIHFHEVTVGEIVGDTGRQTLLFVGQCLQQVALVGIQITAFVEQQQSCHVVNFVKGALIVECSL